MPDGCRGIKAQLPRLNSTRMPLKGHPHSRASSRAPLHLPGLPTQLGLSPFSVLLPSLLEVLIPVSTSENSSQETQLLT